MALKNIIYIQDKNGVSAEQRFQTLVSTGTLDGHTYDPNNDYRVEEGTSSGVSSFGGATGAITLGSNFSMSGNQLNGSFATEGYVNGKETELSARINALSQRGKYLSGYDCSTGVATTNPPSASLVGGVYPYTAGDYFIVAEVGTGTKYIPNGTSYNPSTPAKQTYSGDIALNDTIYYDGTSWSVLHANVPTVNIATTSTAGVVKSSSSGGKVSVDSTTGIMSVNSWYQPSVQATDYTVALRNAYGKLVATTPSSTDGGTVVATKEYVDNAVAGGGGGGGGGTTLYKHLVDLDNGDQLIIVSPSSTAAETRSAVSSLIGDKGTIKACYNSNFNPIGSVSTGPRAITIRYYEGYVTMQNAEADVVGDTVSAL